MSKKLTQEEFVNKIESVHGKKYNFSGVLYTRNRDRIVVECPVHGKFDVIAAHFMAGAGCPKCSIDKKKNTLEEFLNDAAYIYTVIVMTTPIPHI